MPKSGPSKVTRVKVGVKTGPAIYQKWATARVSVPQTAIHEGAGGSMEGWRKSRMTPKGGPSQSEYRRVKR